MQLWLKPDEKIFLTETLEKFRSGTTSEFSTPENNLEDINRINKEIKEGRFYLKSRIASPKYHYDFLNSPALYWHNPLPDALLVVADNNNPTKKWRAVSLKGLGAFPVVWSIVFSLNAYAIAQTPKDRPINLLSHEFETFVKLIVGNATMRAGDDLKGTLLGFCTYPLEVSSLLINREIEHKFLDGILTVIINETGHLQATNAFCDNIEQVTRWRIRPMLDDIREIKEGWNPYMEALSQLFSL